MPEFDCLVAGDANVDLLVEGKDPLEPDTERLASDLNLVLGGSSAITAFNLARLGASVAFAGVIADDMFGRFVEEKLTSGGVNLSGLCRMPDAKTGVTIWYMRGGKRSGLTYPGTISLLERAHISRSLLSTARHLHVGAYFLHTRLHPDAPGLFAEAKALGVTTSLDCNYDPREKWDSNLRDVLANTDVFLPNEDEARAITGASNFAEAARALATLAKVVVVKRGAAGAFAVTGTSQLEMAAASTNVVDTTGAGDSFNAGFLTGFVKGRDVLTCLQNGIAAAARSVQKIGGTAAFED